MPVLSMSMKNLRPRLPGQPLPYHRGTDAESVDSASTRRRPDSPRPEMWRPWLGIIYTSHEDGYDLGFMGKHHISSLSSYSNTKMMPDSETQAHSETTLQKLDVVFRNKFVGFKSHHHFRIC